MHLAVHYLPQFVSASDLAPSTVIVVDLLRASTTICQALAAGAECVIPSVEVDATWAQVAAHVAQGGARDQLLLGGERGGERIEGFQLGNSPREYTPSEVWGKRLLFTTTNGTRALAHAHLAERVLVGATINRQAVADAVAESPRVDILCAGTGGQVSREDLLAAGAIASALHSTTTNRWCDAVRGEWQELRTTARAWGRSPSAQFALELRDTLGGKNLLALGFEDDLEFCAQLDTLEVVPEFHPASGRIALP
jgi:2-phosphosulfolactate phosphatase